MSRFFEVRDFVNEFPSALLDVYENNPRAITESGINKLVKSIREFPGMLKIKPIIARQIGDEFAILAGSQRFRACQKLGMTKVPVQVVECDDETALEIMVKDNTHYGWWSVDDLGNMGLEMDMLHEWGIPKSVLNGFQAEFREDEEVEMLDDFISSIMTPNRGALAVNKRELKFMFDNEDDYNTVLKVLMSFNVPDDGDIDLAENLVMICRQFQKS